MIDIKVANMSGIIKMLSLYIYSVIISYLSFYNKINIMLDTVIKWRYKNKYARSLCSVSSHMIHNSINAIIGIGTAGVRSSVGFYRGEYIYGNKKRRIFQCRDKANKIYFLTISLSTILKGLCIYSLKR